MKKFFAEREEARKKYEERKIQVKLAEESSSFCDFTDDDFEWLLGIDRALTLAPLTDQNVTNVSAETRKTDQEGDQMLTEGNKNEENCFKNELDEDFTFLSSIDMPDDCTDDVLKLTKSDILRLGREREQDLQQGEGKPLFVMAETKIRGR